MEKGWREKKKGILVMIYIYILHKVKYGMLRHFWKRVGEKKRKGFLS